jgi:hypothetical protein
VATLVKDTILRYARAIAPIRAVMLDRLGPNVWHSSPASAMATLEELEETARLCCLVPSALPLTNDAVGELRRVFGASW